ncbi:putative multiple RNA-binding domain-containing protein [Triangularia verruculosa]|uniref:Multiple RNA-binding domain-containing protein 1 n=1 Tax=Triangularia verruculosa TaxID=2587418 RepID=A0AAN7ARQ1_9PEZI|nr:putative multiple RNA-binding domain-containing protein [Triangularia verruculosa]
MESSRIFVKNLPPSISEADFRKHFSAQGREVTDVKLIPNRRIGFVGYKSHEDAAKAVKYFNKSFIRMSRIGVDLAKPIEAAIPKTATQAAHVPSRDAAKAPSLVKSHASEAEPTDDDASSKKRKRDVVDGADAKLQEYLEVMGGHPSKKARDGDAVGGSAVESEMATAIPTALIEGGESDDEYEDIPVRSKRPIEEAPTLALPVATPVAAISPPAPSQPTDEPARELPQVPVEGTDDDWLRSRTNRLLDLVDPDDPEFSARSADVVPVATQAPSAEQAQATQEPGVGAESEVEKQDTVRTPENAVKLIEKTARLFLRNLSYTVTEDNVRHHFSQFGELEEVHVPLDNRGQSKGFAMIRYANPEAALSAFQTDGTVFQGRIIHILPAAAKRENKLDEYAISKLPLKKQQLLKKKAEAASSTFNWNSLFMSQDAVNTAVAERLGVSKHELLDPTDASAAVKQAIAETTVIQEAKAYFATHGVNIEAFKSQQRGDTSILVKNIKNATIEEIRTLFEEHGSVLRVLMPPSGTIAVVQFAQPAHCRAAFARKAYSRFKDSVLYLEKGPKGLFVDNVAQSADRPAGVQKVSASDLLERDDGEDQPETASLFVRNLNFSTTAEGLTNAFKPLDGFVGAQVKTKTDPKKPGQGLSMGFGFCAFKTKEQAQAAQKAMDGHVLDGYKLLVKASHRGLDAAEERRREDLAKKAGAQRTKVVIKNLPFEASKKDVRALFSNYGKLVALRIPKKFNHSSRGFAFAEFSTAKEALNALTALKDTHLLGRRLVLDFAEAEDLDPEEQIKAMEKKMRGQASKVALQQLTGAGRSKVNIGDNDDDEA